MADTPSTTLNTYSLNFVIAAAGIGIVLGALIAWAWFASEPAEDAAETLTETATLPDLSNVVAPATTAEQTGVLHGNGRLEVRDQPAGMSVMIARTSATESEWVVVRESKGNILGAARFIAGASSGAVELLRGTSAGASYVALIYTDNGDRSFSIENDVPVLATEVSFKAQ